MPTKARSANCTVLYGLNGCVTRKEDDQCSSRPGGSPYDGGKKGKTDRKLSSQVTDSAVSHLRELTDLYCTRVSVSGVLQRHEM